MWILVLWRPLVFWDIEQIEEIKKQEIKDKLKKDIDFNRKISKYNDLQNEIDEIERDQEDIYEELIEIAKKYWVSEKEFYKFI